MGRLKVHLSRDEYLNKVPKLNSALPQINFKKFFNQKELKILSLTTWM